MEIIDSHCHLFLEEFQSGPPLGESSSLKRSPVGRFKTEPSPNQPAPSQGEYVQKDPDPLLGVLDRARSAGVSAIVNVALDVDSTLTVIEAARQRPWLHPTSGWHPNQAERLRPCDLERLLELALKPEVVAFGEIGLDYFRNPGGADNQKKAFEGLLEAAAASKKPVIIHCRDAFPDLIKIITPMRSRLAGVLFHCFAGTEDDVPIAISLDCHLSFAGPITFPKAEALRRALAAAPLDRIMVETDAPYLAPAPYRGKRNEPSYLVHHLTAMAAVLGIDQAEAAAITTANAKRFFNLPEPSAA